MNNVYIDTDKLSEEIDKIKKVNTKLEEIFSQIKRNTDVLKDYWSTETSDSVFTSFEQFYVTLENTKNNFQKDIEFLENVVKSSYIEEDEGISSLVDSNIAM